MNSGGGRRPPDDELDPDDRLAGDEIGGGPAPYDAPAWHEPGAESGLGYRGPRRRWPWIALLVLLAFVVAGIGAVAWVRHQVDPGTGGSQVAVDVPEGATLSSLAPTLHRDGVVGSETVFRWWLRLNASPTILPGLYLLDRPESYTELVAALAKGPTEYHLPIPPGFDLTEVAQRVGQLPGHSAAGFLAAAAKGTVASPFLPAGPRNYEGLIWPDTYLVPQGESDQAILQAMVDEDTAEAGRAGLDSAVRPLGLSKYQILVVASIIEREAVVPSDLPKVARVIYNRLEQGMKLQLDSTVLYGAHSSAGAPTAAQLLQPTPYNTYVHSGLPPTPISDPGPAAIAAALHPVSGPWLYYVVVQPDGSEAFSTTYAGQEANVALARSRGLPG